MIPNKGELINNARNEMGADTLQDRLPPLNMSWIMNPRYANIVRRGNNTSTGNLVIYTTPTNADFYLTYIGLSLTKDVACDNALCYLNATIGGQIVVLAVILVQPATASSDYQVIPFTFPLKLDRGSSINLVGSFAAGTLAKSAQIQGFVI